MTMTDAMFDVAIVGGGISGLAAAHALQTAEASPTYVVLEGSDRWGGKIQTERLGPAGTDPFILEAGPDSFITQKPWALQLARQLGMMEQLLPTNDERRQTFVLNRGRPVPLPDGVMLIVPTKFRPFLFSPLISLPGKLRMGLDWFIKPKTDGADETLADFIRRRLGPEALDKIAEPLLAGIYNAEAEKQSILATFPRFRDIETKHGSLIRGMLAALKNRPVKPASGGPQPPSAFISFRGGMAELVTRLLAELAGDLRLNAPVAALDRELNGYRLTLADGEQISARSIILAVPAYRAASLLRPHAPEAATGLDGIRYVSTGTISLAFRADEIGHPLNGFGIVIPRSEKRRINAITWTSTKFANRAPADHRLLRVFFGGPRTPAMMDLGDDELLVTVRQELREIMDITAEPVLQRIYRWINGNPQYDVGHLERVARIEAALPSGLFLTGSPYRGIGVPDCVRQGGEAAARVISHLQENQSEMEAGLRV